MMAGIDDEDEDDEKLWKRPIALPQGATDHKKFPQNTTIQWILST